MIAKKVALYQAVGAVVRFNDDVQFMLFQQLSIADAKTSAFVSDRAGREGSDVVTSWSANGHNCSFG